MAEAAASDFDAVYKIILVGDTGVGKSSILARPTTATDAPPPPPPPPTVGVDFSFRTLEVDGKRVRLHLWDATGKPQYRMITTSYQRVAHVIVFCYDLTRPDTMCTRPPCAPCVRPRRATPPPRAGAGCARGRTRRRSSRRRTSHVSSSAARPTRAPMTAYLSTRRAGSARSSGSASAPSSRPRP